MKDITAAASAPQQKPQFAPLPIRALSDSRLSGRHLRLLGAIAYHDRLGVNGRGCYASQETLARETGIAPNHVAELIAELAAFGYIIVARQQLDARRLSYSIIYDSLDSLPPAGGISYPGDVTKTRNIPPTGGNGAEIPPTANPKAKEGQEDREHNIFRETVEFNKSCETDERLNTNPFSNISSEAASKEARKEALGRLKAHFGDTWFDIFDCVPGKLLEAAQDAEALEAGSGPPIIAEAFQDQREAAA